MTSSSASHAEEPIKFKIVGLERTTISSSAPLQQYPITPFGGSWRSQLAFCRKRSCCLDPHDRGFIMALSSQTPPSPQDMAWLLSITEELVVDITESSGDD